MITVPESTKSSTTQSTFLKDLFKSSIPTSSAVPSVKPHWVPDTTTELALQKNELEKLYNETYTMKFNHHQKLINEFEHANNQKTKVRSMVFSYIRII
jgi:hypothetical protein